MRAETFFFTKETGWSVPTFPELDSDSTLVLAFGCSGEDGSKLVGFYSYGELSPHEGRPAELFNQTMTLTTLAER
jgi:hypothetical protein